MIKILDISSGETEVHFSINGLGNGLSDYLGKDYCWCLVNFKVTNRFFSLERINDELLTFGEVLELREGLVDLLDDKINDICTISFIEPDLEFILHPKLDLRTVKRIIYIEEGLEIRDISTDIIINLADSDGYNGQSYRYPLNRNEIVALKKYLDDVIPDLEVLWDKANN